MSPSRCRWSVLANCGFRYIAVYCLWAVLSTLRACMCEPDGVLKHLYAKELLKGTNGVYETGQNIDTNGGDTKKISESSRGRKEKWIGVNQLDR